MKILEPITIGGVAFKNRIMFPPLTTGYEAADGSISAQSLAFYTRLAKGGVGYIVLGDVAPIRSFTATPKLFDDSKMESFRVLADGVHAYGAKLGLQIFHPEYDCDAINALFSAGEIKKLRVRLQHDMQFFVNEVTQRALLQIVEKICACAMRALKNAVPDMLIDFKLAVVTPARGRGGIDEVDAPQFAKWLQEAGVDMLHVAQANHTGNMADTIPPMGVQPYGFFADIAGAVKAVVSIPVSTAGRIIDPAMAEDVLQRGQADMIGIGRALLADPDWTNKAATDKASDIRRCISCNEGCIDNIQNRTFIACVLNAENGHEETRSITLAAAKKNVVVIGGGPAGLEAARVAAKRGHSVTLFEKETALGGQLRIAQVPPRKQEMQRAVQDLVHAVRTEGVALRLGEKATTESVLALMPDAVIVAVGATSFTPPISGVDGPNVRDAWKVLSGEQRASGRVAVIGGGVVGCETAEHLAVQGCDVVVVEMRDKIASDIGSTVLPTLLETYTARGVEQYPGHEVTRIAVGELICQNKNGDAMRIPCDHVVIAIGARPVTFDSATLKNQGISVFEVGDCREVADISHATKTAYDAADAI